ncbi:hypothetical protein DBR06_SOUSAS210018, partial [Sousa chinensis]
ILASCHRAFRQALPQVSPFCEVKCNSSPWVLHVLATLGTSFDCASQCAACHGVKLLVFDIEKKLTEVAQDHPGPGVTGRAADQRQPEHLPPSAKFGARLEVCGHLPMSARDLGLAVAGVGFHMGSDCQTPQSYMQADADCRHMFEMGCRAGQDMSLLAIKGSFP